MSTSKRTRNSDNARTAATAVVPRRLPSLTFRANFNDHFETSTQALRDVLAAVDALRQLTRPCADDAFTLYDPYYCTGAVVRRWASLGVPRVLHDNRDFYADVRNGTVPGPYDMLVTNPPFSDDHLQRLLHFVTLQQSQPWAFLAPSYVATKPWYVQWVRTHYEAAQASPPPPRAATRGRGGGGSGRGTTSSRTAAVPITPPPLPPFLRDEDEADDEAAAAAAAATTRAQGQQQPSDGDKGQECATSSSRCVGVEPFYIVPRERYDFAHPTGAGNAHSHFHSMWFVWAGRRTAEVIRATRVALLHAAATTTATTAACTDTRRRDDKGKGSSNDKTVTTATTRTAPVVVHGLAALRDVKHAGHTQKTTTQGGNAAAAAVAVNVVAHGHKRMRSS